MMDFLHDQWAIATAIPLVLCSVVALAMIIERLVYLHSRKMMSDREAKQLLNNIANCQYSQAIEKVQAGSLFFEAAFIELIETRNNDKSHREAAVALAVRSRTRLLKHRLSAI